MNKKEKAFIAACTQLGDERGISREELTDAIQESFRVAFAKKIENEYKLPKGNGPKRKIKSDVKLDDALIRTEINFEKAKIKVFHQFEVVEDDLIEDDYLQIGLTDAKNLNKKLKVGDYYEEPLDIDSLSMSEVNRFMSCFKQRIAKAEKEALLANFQNKIGTVVTGEVEKSDSHSVIVNLGRTSTALFKKDLIGDEKFNPGDSIKVYIQGIGKDDKKASLIQASRSCPGFLRCLFENEIHEVYDGTVIIKDVARIAGRRAKVCVYSNDPNVDPSGACIGQNGNRIQSIVSQLGNAKDNKEKIDVVTYNYNLGLYLVELLKPGRVLGLIIDEENKQITAVCENDTKVFAIGSKGTNVILARKLTGYNIEVIEESEAIERGLEYKTVEEFTVEAREEERKRFRERQEELRKDYTPVEETEVEENFTEKEDLGDEDIYDEVEDINIEETPVEPQEEVKVEETPVEVKEEEVKVEEPVVEETPVEEPVVQEEPAHIEIHEVKTTTTLESLEKSLEEEKKEKENKTSTKKKFKKEEKKNTSEDDEFAEKKPVQKMDIYTDEELAELEEELEESDEYEEEDYSEYDSDEYYEGM